MTKALIVVKDQNISKQIVACLQSEHGFSEFALAKNGDEAAKALTGELFAAVVMDIDLEGSTSAPGLFNRLRAAADGLFTPVMVVAKSSLKERFTLFKDFPPTGLYEGAFAVSAFSLKFKTLMREGSWFLDEYRAADVGIGDAADLPQIQDWVKQRSAAAPTTTVVPNAVAGLLCRRGQYEFAAQVAAPVLKLGSTNGLASFFTAVCKVKTKQYQLGLGILQAQGHSAQDLQRLLLKVECYLGLRQFADAEKACRSLTTMDPGHPWGKAGVTLSALAQEYAKTNTDLSPGITIAKFFLKALAAQISAKMVTTPVPLYEAILAFCTDDLERAKVFYDLGLLHVEKEKKKALTYFQEAAKLGGKALPEAHQQVIKLGGSKAA